MLIDEHKVEDYKTTVPIGERSGEIIEPLLTDQWFMKMDALAKPAIAAVKKSNIKFVPKNWEKIYFRVTSVIKNLTVIVHCLNI